MSDYDVKREDLAAFRVSIMRLDGGSLLPYRSLIEIHPRDTSTGLPSVPAGYFWRVRPWSTGALVSLFFAGEGTEEVQTGWWLFTRTITRKTPDRKLLSQVVEDSRGEDDNGEADLYTAANRLLQRLPEHLLRYAPDKDFSSLHGDYPPKRLKGA